MTLEKCYILNTESNERIKAMFNPNEYSFAKQNEWKNEPLKGRDLPKPEFTGGRAATLQVQLFFDTYEDKVDVRKHTEKIWKLMEVAASTKNQKTKQGRPPIVVFGWGKNVWNFKAVIVSCNQKFTMFLPDGTPVRATVDLTLQQVEQTGLYQNPTSHGIPGATTRVINESDTLAQIAYEEYGNANEWRRIAELNKISNPRKLRTGDILIIPPL